jgi:phosphoglycolate phosphatase (TIGR01487 family)
MTIEAIAVDIDGTITDDTRKICISAIESLRKAEDAGIPTIIVTGNVVNYAYAAEVLIGCSGGLVAENGGVVFKEGENNNAVETMVERDFVTSAENHLKEKLGEKFNKHASHDNMYRLTETVFYKTIDREELEEALKDFKYLDNLEIYDSGFALHITDKRVNKGSSLKYLCERNVFIASIYQKGNCSNLRTLKYNLDIYEHIFDIIGDTIQSEGEQHVKSIADYMLLLSMVYSIEYRRDNDEAKLKSLSKINRQWIYQLDTMDSLSRQSGNNEDKQKSQAEKSEEEKIVDYQRYIKKCYFANSYIYGSSMPMIEYLLTGYCDEDAMRANIQWIEVEAKRYEASEEKQLYQELTQFWDTDDDVMANAVKRTMEKVKEGSFLLQDYPLFFLALQRLQNFSFIDLKMTIPELQEIFESAISKFENVPFVDGLDAYYYQNNGESTPEFMALVNKVIDINAHNNQKYLVAEFETVVKNISSSVNLKKFQFVLTCLFENIGAEQFFELFISYRNSRKRDYWNFFDERYNSKDCFDLDREFIASLLDRLNRYLSDPSIEISGTRKYCSKIQELLDKKVQQWGVM